MYDKTTGCYKIRVHRNPSDFVHKMSVKQENKIVFLLFYKVVKNVVTFDL